MKTKCSKGKRRRKNIKANIILKKKMLHTTEISKATKMLKLPKRKQNVQRESAEQKT